MTARTVRVARPNRPLCYDVPNLAMGSAFDIDLAAAFLSRRPLGAIGNDEQLLGEIISRAVSEAKAAWPTVALPADDFVAYFAERADFSLAPVAAVASLELSDLYLSYGCLRGDGAAVAGFDARFMARLPPLLGRINPAQAFIDEVLQELRVSLLVGNECAPEDREPKIGQYRGRGPLKTWLEVSAKRLALAHVRGQEDHQDLAELTLAAAAEDPALEQLRQRYTDDFRAVVKTRVAAALASLSVEERNLLRWHLVDNVSLRRLALMRGTNVSTVSRDYARIRARILDEVRDALCARAGLAQSEADSVMGALLSRISISIVGALGRS